jgi:tetratricopeptide (TPR) repeat protein
MKSFSLFVFILLTMFFLAGFGATGLFTNETATAIAGDKTQCPPDKALCAKMIRAGQEYCERGKYKEAKEAFRRAVQADPHSARAWHFYDICFIYSYAIELRSRPAPPPEATTSAPAKGTTAPVTPTAEPEEDDEGC